MKDDYWDRPELFILQRIRKNFRNEKFKGVELWRLFGANVTLNYWGFKQKKTGLLISILQLINCLFIYDIRLFIIYSIKKITYPKKSSYVIIEALSDEYRVRGLWLPVAEKFGEKGANLLTEDFNIYKKYKESYNIILSYKMNFFSWVLSRFYIFYQLSKYFKYLKVDEDFTKHYSTRIDLISSLCMQFNRILKANYVFHKYSPKAFTTTWDWYPLGAAYCNTLNLKGVETFTFIHGAAGRQSFIEFIPTNAKYIFSWGRHNTHLLIENGVKLENIIECGIQRIEKYTPSDKATISKIKIDIGLDDSKKTIGLFYTAQITNNWINDTTQLFNQLSGDYQFICRPHPSTERIKFQKIIPKKNGIYTCYPSEIQLTKTIEMCDYIIIDSSTAGFDALLMGKIVFVLDTGEIAKTQDVMLDACESGAAVMCRSDKEIYRKLQSIENDLLQYDKLKKNIRLFKEYYISAYGDEAVENIANSINTAIGKVS